MPRLPPTPLAVCAQIGLIFSAAGVGGVLGALLGGGVQRRCSFGRVIVTTTVLMALLFPFCGLRPSRRPPSRSQAGVRGSFPVRYESPRSYAGATRLSENLTGTQRDRAHQFR